MDNVFLAEYDNYIFIALAIAGWLFKTFRSSFSKSNKEHQSLKHEDQINSYADQKIAEPEQKREISPIEQYLMELESQGHNVSEIMEEIEEDEVLEVVAAEPKIEEDGFQERFHKREERVVKETVIKEKRTPSKVKRKASVLPELKKKENLRKAFVYSEVFKTKF